MSGASTFLRSRFRRDSFAAKAMGHKCGSRDSSSFSAPRCWSWPSWPFFLTPLAVAGGLRLWLTRTAQQEGLRIEFEKIEAPLLRPVVVHNLKVTSESDAPFHVKIEAPRVEFAPETSPPSLSQSSGRLLRSLAVESDRRGRPSKSAATRRSAPTFRLAALRAMSRGQLQTLGDRAARRERRHRRRSAQQACSPGPK